MKGLLIKDIYVAWKMCWVYFAVEAIFILLTALGGTSPFILLIPTYLITMIPMTMLITDERARWHIYADGLPVTRAQVVASKFILMIVLNALSAVLMLAAGCIAVVNPMLAGEGHTVGDAAAAAVFCPAIMAFSSLSMPFTFRVGFEKGRYGYMIICVIAGAFIGTASASGWDFSRLNLGAVKLSVAAAVIIAASAAIFAVSWLLSAALYKTREF